MIRVNAPPPSARRRSVLVHRRGARWTAEVQLACLGVKSNVCAQAGNVASGNVNVVQSRGADLTIGFSLSGF